MTDRLRQIVETAAQTFNDQERYLLEKDLSERCICACFATHITKALQSTELEAYVVDVEYNRGADGNERSPKRIDDKIIVVDLIVHKRGYECRYGFDNLICIEMKKSTDRRGYTMDEARLKKMTDAAYGFCYRLGVMVVADMKQKCLKLHKTFRWGQEITD